MIQVPATANVLIMHESISFNKGIDGTVAVARVVLEKEPMDGAFFVFRNKGRHMLRVLHYDGSGFWICTKRLSKGRFKWWPHKRDRTSVTLLVHELQLLIWNGDPESAGRLYGGLPQAFAWRFLREVFDEGDVVGQRRHGRVVRDDGRHIGVGEIDQTGTIAVLVHAGRDGRRLCRRGGSRLLAVGGLVAGRKSQHKYRQ